MPARGSSSSGGGGEAISEGKARGEGGGRREVVELRMLGGVDIGEEGGEAWRRRLVRREDRKAVGSRLESVFGLGVDSF